MSHRLLYSMLALVMAGASVAVVAKDTSASSRDADATTPAASGSPAERGSAPGYPGASDRDTRSKRACNRADMRGNGPCEESDTAPAINPVVGSGSPSAGTGGGGGMRESAPPPTARK